MAKTDLTAERVRDLLNYDPETGIFTWRYSRVGVRKGTVAGSNHCSGYISIRVDPGRALAHRLAWLYVYGEWPPNDIDHINGIRTDNRLKNLRCLTRGQNLQNQRVAKSHNKLGILGVFEDTRTKRAERYIAVIVVDGKQRRLGRFADPHEAHAAYIEAKRKFHEANTL